MDKELLLKGSLYGTTKFVPYKNPDIIHSVVDNHICLSNKWKIKYLQEKKKYYMYHFYHDGLVKYGYSGRWYYGDYIFSSKDLNPSENTFTLTLKSVEWEDDTTHTIVIKDVDITIKLTNSGFQKLEAMLK